MDKNNGKCAGRTAITAVLSLLACVALLFTAVLTAARITVSSRNIARIVAAPDLGDQVEENYILERLKEQEGLDGAENLTADEVVYVLKQDFVQKFIQSVAGEYVDALLNGRDVPRGAELTADFLTEHEADINKALAKAGFRGNIKVDAEMVRESLEWKLDRVFPVEILREQYARSLSVLRSAVSTGILLAVWGIYAALTAVIFLINRKKLCGGFLGVGIPALAVGTLLLALAFFVGTVIGNNNIIRIIRLAAKLLHGPLIFVGTVCGALGSVLTALGTVLKIARKKQGLMR